MGSLLDSNIHF